MSHKAGLSIRANVLSLWQLCCSAEMHDDSCSVVDLSTVHTGQLCHRAATLHRSVYVI